VRSLVAGAEALTLLDASTPERAPGEGLTLPHTPSAPGLEFAGGH